MSDTVEEKDVNTDEVEDRVTEDHDAGLGSSVEDLDHQNPDIEDYDEALKDFDELLEEAEDTSGGTENTDDSSDLDADSGKGEDEAEKGKEDGDKRVPKSRLDDVIAQRNDLRKEMHEKEIEWARREAMFESRLAALEKPLESKPVTDPIDELLAGEAQEVLDRFQEDPVNFVNLVRNKAKADAISEIKREAEEKAYQDSMSQALDSFAKEHQDFIENAHRIVEVVNRNPIHNAISAYAYEIEIPALKASHEAALKGVNEQIEKAKKEAFILGKKEAIKEIQAKGAASVLDGSQSNQSGRANAGSDLDTGKNPVKLREKITAELLKKRGVTG